MRWRDRLLAAGATALMMLFAVSACSPNEPPASREPTSPSTVPTEPAPPDVSSDEQPDRPELFVLTSPAFADGERMPAVHALSGVGGGRNQSVPLSWAGVPEGTKSLALAMVDRHPVANDWVHWIVVDIPPNTAGLPAGASGNAMPPGSRELLSSYGRRGYGGPAPPAGTGDHDYVFTLYALDVESLSIGERPSAADIERAVAGHVIASATLVGTFSR